MKLPVRWFVAVIAFSLLSACSEPVTAVATMSTFYHASPAPCLIEPVGNVAHVVHDDEKTRSGKGALLKTDRPGTFDVKCGNRTFKYVVRNARRLELAPVAQDSKTIDADAFFTLRLEAFDRDGGALKIGGWTQGIEFTSDARSTPKSESHPLFCCATPQRRFLALAPGTTTVSARWNGLAAQTTRSIVGRRKSNE